MLVCGAIQGPLHHYFYQWMDNIMPAVSMKTTIYKILLDEGIASPLCLLLFFYPACLMEGKTLSESTNEIKSKFLTIYLVTSSESIGFLLYILNVHFYIVLF